MANIYLGNMTTKQITERLGITLTDQEYEDLNNTRIENADVHDTHGWHGFDIPFSIVCGDQECSDMWITILTPHSDELQDTINILKGWG